MVDRFARFSFAISEISRCWHRIAGEQMGLYGLKGPYAVYFTALYRYPDGITAAQLAEQCGRDKADVSRALTLLESRGFVSREQKSYRSSVRLTQTGKALAEEINRKAQIAVEQASCGVFPEKRAVFYEVLEQITENLQILSQNGLPEAKEKEKNDD